MDKKCRGGRRHKFQKVAESAIDILFRCSVCSESFRRPSTPGERKRFLLKLKKGNEYSKKLHKIWWEFCDLFGRDKNWKYHGYHLMDLVDKWSQKYPKDVWVLVTDDVTHSTSYLVYIAHRVGKEIWGISVVSITQCDEADPKVYFLYPDNWRRITRLHQTIEKMYRAKR